MAAYRDYYAILGVARTASADEIQRAYRSAARRLHPDVSKAPDAAAKFSELNEAYEVLKDDKKRSLYDQLGSNWKAGQDVPSGGRAWTGRQRSGPAQAPQGESFDFDFDSLRGSGGFSDFFESLFGAAAAGQPRSAGPAGEPPSETELTVSIGDLLTSARKSVTIDFGGSGGGFKAESRSLDIKIPPGATDGTVIRLAGQGASSLRNGKPRDLLLRLRLEPSNVIRLAAPGSHDLIMTLPISPWEAALGAKVHASLPNQDIVVSIPAESQTGQKLRVRGAGLPKRQSAKGDLYLELRIDVPKNLSDAERGLLENWKRISNFDPRHS